MIIIYLLHIGACTCHRFYYNDVVSFSDGQLGLDASSFNISKLERIVATLAAEPAWKEFQTGLVASCRNPSSPNLTARQQAIYSYICVRWSLLIECDSMQYTSGRLEEEALERRNMLLLGDHPTSPKNLFPELRLRPWNWCSFGIDDNPSLNKIQRYEAALNATKCIMKDYIDDFEIGYNRVNFSRLHTDLSSKDPNITSVKLLKEIVERCALYRVYYHATRTTWIYYGMTADEFINCWATQGILDIIKKEADIEARVFPEGCSFRLDNSKEQGYSN